MFANTLTILLIELSLVTDYWAFHEQGLSLSSNSTISNFLRAELELKSSIKFFVRVDLEPEKSLNLSLSLRVFGSIWIVYIASDYGKIGYNNKFTSIN